MRQEILSTFYKIAINIVGGASLIFAVTNLPKVVFSWSFAFFLIFTLLITPRMSIALPRSKTVLNFSDSIIFLAFILYGGSAAILLAAIETFANCIYLKRRGLIFSNFNIACNVSSVTVSTAITYVIWSVFLNFSVINFIK